MFRVSISGLSNVGKTTLANQIAEMFGALLPTDPFHEHLQLIDPVKSWIERSLMSKTLTLMSAVAKLQSVYLTEHRVVFDRCFLDLMIILQCSLDDMYKSPVYDSLDVLIHQGLCFQHDLSILILRDKTDLKTTMDKEAQRLLLKNFYTLKSNHYAVIPSSAVFSKKKTSSLNRVLEYLKECQCQ